MNSEYTTQNPPSGGSVQGRAREDAEQIKKEASAEASKAADAAKSKADDGLTKAGKQVDQLSEAIDAAAKNLSDQDKEGLAQYARQLSSSMSEMADNLQNRSIDELANNAREFARNNPTGFLLGSIALGFGLSRFVKATSNRDQGDVDATGTEYPRATGGTL